MRKYILIFILSLFTIVLCGCNNNKELEKFIQSADKIIITKGANNETIELNISITDDDTINHIVENINSLTLEEMDYIKPHGIMYTLAFYDDKEEVKIINIISSRYLSHSDSTSPFYIKKGEIDLDYLDSLFNNLSLEDKLEQSIIYAYKERYQINYELEIDKIYKTFNDNGKDVTAFKIGGFADDVVWDETVGGIKFYYGNHRRIEVFCDNQIYTLLEAYNEGIITKTNLIDLSKIVNAKCVMGHSFDDGEIIQVPGGGYETIYTCLVCGHTTNDNVNNGNTYSLTVIGKTEYMITDINGEYTENALITLAVQLLIDADIEVYVNDIKISPTTKPTPTPNPTFIFSMPGKDTIVEIKVVTLEYVSLQDLNDFEWAKELNKEDIKEVRYESSAIGIKPGNLVDIKYSKDIADISNLYDALILGLYVETDMEYAAMDGGGYIKYTFITNDNAYELNLTNGFIVNVPDLIISSLKFDYYKFLGETYQFKNPYLECNSFLVYDTRYKAYKVENDILIDEYDDLDEFEFIPYDGVIPEYLTPYYIETSIGRIYIHTNNIFYFKDKNTFTYYKIVGEKDFSFLFNNTNYDIKNLYAQYPMFATQRYFSNNSKFDVIIEEDIEPGKIPFIIDIENINCESLQTLFNTNLSDQYLMNNYKALWFLREEPIDTDALEDITYKEIFVEGHIVYVSVYYNSKGVGGEAFSYYEDLILIPNEWEKEIYTLEIKFNLENHFYLGRKMIMSYDKMQEFKNAYREQILDNLFDDQMYREIYILDVYGEFNDCLVATVTYDGYVHTDVCMPMVETFGDVTITYDARYPIYVCYNSTLYSLTDAFNNGYLTIDDIAAIARKA